MPKFWNMTATNNEAEINIYGEIVSSGWEWEADTSAHTFQQDLSALGEVNVINLHINSPGGSVFEGIAIYQMLVQHKAKVVVHIDGLAASIASVIAMAGDVIKMPNNAMLMVHNPWTYCVGNANDLRKQADDLDKISLSMKESYLNKTKDKLSEDKLKELLDNETWLSASEAIQYGLADELLEENRMAACISDKLFASYKNVPQQLTEKTKEPTLLDKKLKAYKGE